MKRRKVVVSIAFACVMAWLGKDGSSEERQPRLARVDALAEPTPSTNEKKQRLGRCIISENDEYCYIVPEASEENVRQTRSRSH